MFGEEKMNIEKYIPIDAKRRIKLPTCIKVVKEEAIGFLLSQKQDRLLIYNKEEYEEILNKAFLALQKMKQKKSYDSKFLRTLERNFFALHCFPEEEVSTTLKVILPKRAIERLQFNTSIYIVGVETHLELFKDENHYKKTLI